MRTFRTRGTAEIDSNQNNAPMKAKTPSGKQTIHRDLQKTLINNNLPFAFCGLIIPELIWLCDSFNSFIRIELWNLNKLQSKRMAKRKHISKSFRFHSNDSAVHETHQTHQINFQRSWLACVCSQRTQSTTYANSLFQTFEKTSIQWSLNVYS